MTVSTPAVNGHMSRNLQSATSAFSRYPLQSNIEEDPSYEPQKYLKAMTACLSTNFELLRIDYLSKNKCRILELWEIPKIRDEFFGPSNFFEKIGEGTYANVYLGPSGYVFKCFKFKNNSSSEVQILMDEYFYRLLNHPLYVSVFPFIENGDLRRAVVLKYGGESLYSLILSYRDQQKKFSYEKITIIAFQVLQQLSEMAKKGIVHGDLKPLNILIVPESQQVQIIDFGHSLHKLFNGRTIGNEYLPTWFQRPPEVEDKRNPKLDMWSLGCVLAEMILKLPPFQYSRGKYDDFNDIPDEFHKRQIYNILFGRVGGKAPLLHQLNSEMIERSMNRFNKVFKGRAYKSYGDYQGEFLSKELQLFDLINGLLCPNIDRRLSAFEAMNHPALKDVSNIQFIFSLSANEVERDLEILFPQINLTIEIENVRTYTLYIPSNEMKILPFPQISEEKEKNSEAHPPNKMNLGTLRNYVWPSGNVVIDCICWAPVRVLGKNSKKKITASFKYSTKFEPHNHSTQQIILSIFLNLGRISQTT